MKTDVRGRPPRLFVLAAGGALLLLSLSANPATPRAPHGNPRWHGDISRFHQHDWGVWRGGHWTHGVHGGRTGWWWVVGGAWYFYPSPVYPYPNPWEPAPIVLAQPSPLVEPLPPVTQYWYFCEASRTYYPYVATCPGGWKQVPAVPGDAAVRQR